MGRWFGRKDEADPSYVLLTNDTLVALHDHMEFDYPARIAEIAEAMIETNSANLKAFREQVIASSPLLRLQIAEEYLNSRKPSDRRLNGLHWVLVDLVRGNLMQAESMLLMGMTYQDAVHDDTALRAYKEARRIGDQGEKLVEKVSPRLIRELQWLEKKHPDVLAELRIEWLRTG
jgi:hypothetical protein